MILQLIKFHKCPIKYQRISSNLNQIRQKLLTQLNTELANAALVSLISFENKTFAARLCAERISKFGIMKLLKTVSPFKSRMFLNKSQREQEAYEYFFFSCCRKIYDELKLLSSSGFFESEIKEQMLKIENLKNQRDSQEHGSEDIWNLMYKAPRKEQSKEQLARKARKKGDSDFTKNMEVLDGIYCEVSSILLT